jgi:TolB-like protein
MSMRGALCSTLALANLGLTAAFGGQGARADVAPAQPVALAVLNLDYVDTSGEPTDQTAAHHQRAADFVSALQRDLAANGQYRVVSMSCGSAPCEPVMNPVELQKAARAAGARFVVLGGVHKMSTLVQWAKIQVADEEQGRIVFDRLLTFRGDTDEAWQRAESFIARDVLNSAPTFGKQDDAVAPVKLALFDFELEDFSGGAGIIPESDQDREQLKLATETARRLLTESGRYSLVDVSHAEVPEVTAGSLHKCDGCDVPIARKLGADQSLVGTVNRISRMEYGVTFHLRDARTGKLLSAEQTDLRMGANYSWSRGADWLIKNRLLEKQAQK